MPQLQRQPAFTLDEVRRFAAESYGLEGVATSLPSERDQNVRLQTASTDVVVKIANADEDPAFVDAQTEAMRRVATVVSGGPQVLATVDGRSSVVVQGPAGDHRMRVVSFVPGQPLAARKPVGLPLAERLGEAVGELDDALTGFDHPSLRRPFDWNLDSGLDVVARYGGLIADSSLSADVREWVRRFEAHVASGVGTLRRGAIHNDANDHNVIVAPGPAGGIAGIIDFGDMVFAPFAAELAIAAAYAVLDAPEPLDVLAALVHGYQRANPLRSADLDAVYGLMGLRLCVSASMAAHQQRQRPDDPYLSISQAPLARTLPRLLERPFALGRQVVRDAASGAAPPTPWPTPALAEARRRTTGANLSVGYRRPLHLRRGFGQYLFDADGRRFLDAYNNVPHVGHCHPRVVAAAERQQRRLATNTRYLYAALPRYIDRLCDTLPDGLDVAFVVNSASEANELALRMCRAATARRDMVVLEAAYHGNTTTLIDLSPYKHAGPGGQGAPAWVHVAALPDTYRGRFVGPDAGARYAATVREAIAEAEANGTAIAGFLAETCPSVGGQLMLPPGYLAAVYADVRAAGGLCIADEVQTGLGRLGDCMYAFEPHGVVPDIVVLGKPLGNGHPLAAVVTTKAIADTFANGMEFFSTFGGNPVSCDVGLAVLDVLVDEGLVEHARAVGLHLSDGLSELAAGDAAIGDVRGRGMFWGVELVTDPDSKRPDATRASEVSNRMREAAVLIGIDGPDHNVLKIRPPMPLHRQDADQLVDVLGEALRATTRS